MSNTNIYFYEGETEESLIKSLKSNERIPHGKTKKENFWNLQRVNGVIRQFPRTKPVVYIIFDTDTTGNLNRFITNINHISSHCKKVILLPQHMNFEGEIAYSCDTSIAELPQFIFGAKCGTQRKFKNRIISEHELLIKLELKGFSQEKLWRRLSIRDRMNFTKQNIKWGL